MLRKKIIGSAAAVVMLVTPVNLFARPMGGFGHAGMGGFGHGGMHSFGPTHGSITGSFIFGILGTDITSQSLSPVSVSVTTPPIVVGNGCQPHTVGIGHGYAITTTTIECEVAVRCGLWC